jgi:CDP-diacylglycerol pyrophosphatase
MFKGFVILGAIIGISVAVGSYIATPSTPSKEEAAFKTTYDACWSQYTANDTMKRTAVATVQAAFFMNNQQSLVSNWDYVQAANFLCKAKADRAKNG